MASSLVDVETGNGVTPLTIVTQKHSSNAEIEDNVRVNIKRDTIRFMKLPGLLRERPEPLAICGGGPSLDKYADKIKAFRQVMTCGSAHDHVVSLGIKPSFALAVDAKEDAVEYFTNPQPHTSYLLASQCHPNMYERLKDNKVAMWHFRGQSDDDTIFNGEPQISWGCMVGVISLQLALFLGFQQLHFFGFDCSYVDDKHHSYDVGVYNAQVDERKQVFMLNGRPFYSTMALISQMEHLYDVFASDDGRFLKGYVYGDGLWANNIKASPPEMKEWLEAIQ